VDILSIVNITVAAVAVTISVSALTAARRQQRFDAILRVEDFLQQEDAIHGRRLLYESAQRGKLSANEEDIHNMFRAITRFDTAATLVRSGLVPKRWMLETWHRALQELHGGLLLLIDYQRHNWRQPNLWPNLTDLIEEALKFKCERICCNSDLEEARPRFGPGPPSSST
jgi:hypothetical protein